VNQIGDVGVKALAAALPLSGLSSLQTLDLEGNQVGDDGAVALAAALPESGLRSLQTLFLK